MDTIGVEGSTLKTAILQACEQLEVSERNIRYKLDIAHFRDDFGKVRGVDTVKILAWAVEADEAVAEEEVEPEVVESEKPSRPAPQRRASRPSRSDEGSSRRGRERSQSSNSEREPEIDDPSLTAEKLNYVQEFVSSAFKALGLDSLAVTLNAGEEGERSTLQIDGLSDVDLDRGLSKRLLGSLEYLANRLSPPQGGRGPRVTFDFGSDSGGNEKERGLQAVAAKVVEHVLEREKSLTLKPMNSYERRIIHLAVAEYEGVGSKSVGDGSRKRVKVFPLNEDD